MVSVIRLHCRRRTQCRPATTTTKKKKKKKTDPKNDPVGLVSFISFQGNLLSRIYIRARSPTANWRPGPAPASVIGGDTDHNIQPRNLQYRTDGHRKHLSIKAFSDVAIHSLRQHFRLLHQHLRIVGDQPYSSLAILECWRSCLKCRRNGFVFTCTTAFRLHGLGARGLKMK